MRRGWWISVWMGGLALGLAAPAAAQPSKSADLVTALSKKMTAEKLTYLVAPDTQAPDRFVGAFHLPDIELRVVAAQYAAPAFIKEHLRKREYQEAYVELSSASTLETRTFIDDLLADGLTIDPPAGSAADTYQVGNTTITFNDDWRSQNLTEERYKDAFTKAEAEYIRVLTLLTEQLGQSGQSQ